MKHFAVFSCLVASCSSNSEVRATDIRPLPTNGEIAVYVQEHWHGWDLRFARLANGPEDQKVALVNVRDSECQRHQNVAKCQFVIKGRFANGTYEEATAVAFFDRDRAGKLIEVLIS